MEPGTISTSGRWSWNLAMSAPACFASSMSRFATSMRPMWLSAISAMMTQGASPPTRIDLMEKASGIGGILLFLQERGVEARLGIRLRRVDRHRRKAGVLGERKKRRERLRLDLVADDH